MQYVFGVWSIGLILLGVRAGCLTNKLIGYLRTYYPEIGNKIRWYPWFVYSPVLRAYCREHHVEDPQLEQLRQTAIRAISVVYLWALAMVLLFISILLVAYLFG